MAWRTISQWIAETAERRVQIQANDEASLFRFVEQRFVSHPEADDAPWDEGRWSGGFWADVGDLSGYYPTAKDAERAAREEVRWLRSSG